MSYVCLPLLNPACLWLWSCILPSLLITHYWPWLSHDWSCLHICTSCCWPRLPIRLIWLYITTECLTRLLSASAPVITVGSCHKPVESSHKPGFQNLWGMWSCSLSSACPSCRASVPTRCPPRYTRPATPVASSTINIYRHSCYSCPLALSVSFSARPGVEIQKRSTI